MENKVYLGLGSNKEDRLEYLRKAVYKLNSIEGSKIVKCSYIYLTKPYGGIKQSEFFNCVCEFHTGLDLIQLFHKIKEIEERIGRTRTEKWGPREIDIDILLYNDLIYCDDKLIVPHKELAKRDFVVKPLAEISPDLIHPQLNIKIADIDFAKEEEYIIDIIKTNLI